MYIGNTPTTQAFTFGTDSFDGDGTTLQFTLSRSIPNVFAITVIVNNVPQNPFTNSFSVNSNILTFTEAPSIGTKNVWVFYNSYITQLIQPGIETVNTNTIVPNAVTYAKIQQVSAGKVLGRDTSGAGVVQELPIAVAANGNVGIGTSSPSTKLQVVGNRIRIGDTTNDPGIEIYNGVGVQGYLFHDTANNLIVLRHASNSGISVDTSANFRFNSGYGSVATAYGCRAWVNFNGTGTVAIRASGNVSSITDNGTGNYTLNFATSMPDVTYAVVGTASQASGGATGMGIVGKNEDAPLFTTGSYKIYTLNTNNATADYPYVNLSVFR